MSEERMCASCKFFRRGAVTVPDPAWTAPPSAGWVPTVVVPAETGECRQNSPVPVGLVGASWVGRWPTVNATEGCGRYEAAPADARVEGA
jgi:hypothetical protein